jgi:hypothetical protein
MKPNSSLGLSSISKSGTVLAIVLSISLIATGCSAQWMSATLADLPVLIQMALNISTIVTTPQSGHQISVAEAAVIQNISAQASKDLNLLATLYNEYKTNPSASALQKIQGCYRGHRPESAGLLAGSAHRRSGSLGTGRSGVDLILTTVASFAALMPQPRCYPWHKRWADGFTAI